MRLTKLIVTFFFIGHAKIAPGTIASLVTSLLFYLFAKHFIYHIFIIVILVTTLIAFFSISIYTYSLPEKDKSEIVIDEVIGQSIALLPILFFSERTSPDFFMCIISLLLFRFFDIVKPYPINKFDKMNNTFGVMFDNL